MRLASVAPDAGGASISIIQLVHLGLLKKADGTTDRKERTEESSEVEVNLGIRDKQSKLGIESGTSNLEEICLATKDQIRFAAVV